jgi:hypothetical protein
MDHTYLLNRARVFIGRGVTGEIDFSDEDLLKLLDQKTLPTFSIYMPWMEDVQIDVRRDQIDPGRVGIFQLRTNSTIIGVERIRETTEAFGAYPFSMQMAGDTLDRQLVADRRSMTEVAITHEFSAPNIVEVFPKGLIYTLLTAKTRMVHPLHLRTVPFGARETLEQLYLADVATDILNVRRYYSTLQTPFGEINLNLDHLQTQADKRDDLIAQLAGKQLKSGHVRRMWVA